MPSSMETVPTDMVDGFGSDEDANVNDHVVWGRLFPIGSSFTALGLVFCCSSFVDRFTERPGKIRYGLQLPARQHGSATGNKLCMT